MKETLNTPEHIKAIQEMNKHLEDFRRDYKVKDFKSIEASKKVFINT